MSSSLKRHFDDDLSCPVCLETFVGDHLPKDLDCPHVCCQTCLNKLPSDIIGAIRCPQCLRITAIPPGGVPALRTNLRVRSLAEKLNDHKRANLGKTCLDHDDQEVLFFCKTCSTPICQYCIISEHYKHSYEPIKSIVVLQKQKLERALHKVEAQLNKCEDIDKKLTETEEMLAQESQLAESKIDQHIQECLDEVNKQGSELKAKLKSMKTTQLDTVQRQKESNGEHIRRKREIVIQVQTTCAQVSDAEYMGHHQKWFANLKALIEDEPPCVSSIDTIASGFMLKVGPSNMTLGLSLMPKQSSHHNVPSTSSIAHDEETGQGDDSKRSSDIGKQKPSSSTNKIEDDDRDVLIVSDTEFDNDINIFDLTDMLA